MDSSSGAELSRLSSGGVDPSQMQSMLIMVVALIFLVVMSAYFSASETAFTSLNRIRLKNKAEHGDKRAQRTLALADDFDRLLSTILIGNNIVNITATTLSTVLFTKLTPLYGPIVSTIVLTITILIFGEVTPKSLAKEQPEKIAMLVSPSLRIFAILLEPGNILFSKWKQLMAKVFQSEGDDGITEEELVSMVGQAETEGGLDQHESQLIRAAIEFNDLEVSEILTPRVDLEAISDDTDIETVAKRFQETGHSRLPVYHETVDNITGILHEKNFNTARLEGKVDLNQIKTPALYTTESTKISELLRILQKNKAHMTVVVDEYGGTEGIATLEDILEQLVGEIWDEHDEVIEEFIRLDDGSYLVACSSNLDDMFELFSVKGSSNATTVSGWVMEEIGRIPSVGDRFQDLGLEIEVTNVENRRVIEIRVEVLEQ